jgi:phasin family protein
MYNTAESFAELNQASVAQVTRLATLAIENVEKLAEYNLLTAKTALAQSVERTQAAIAVEDVQQLLALYATFAESGVRAALGYWKNLYEIATAVQAQFSGLAEDAWGAYTQGVAVWVEKARKSAPAGSDAAVDAFKQTFAASNAAIDQFSQATQQVVTLADAGVRTAAADTTNAVTVTKRRKASAAPRGRKAA